MLDTVLSRTDRSAADRRMVRKSSMMFAEELLHGILPTCQKQYAFLIVLNVLQDEFPWVYTMGKGLVDILQSTIETTKKLDAITDFRRLLDFTFEHPAMRESISRKQGISMYQRDIIIMMRDVLPMLLREMEEELT